jgi:hypothetical protein
MPWRFCRRRDSSFSPSRPQDDPSARERRDGVGEQASTSRPLTRGGSLPQRLVFRHPFTTTGRRKAQVSRRRRAMHARPHPNQSSLLLRVRTAAGAVLEGSSGPCCRRCRGLALHAFRAEHPVGLSRRQSQQQAILHVSDRRSRAPAYPGRLSSAHGRPIGRDPTDTCHPRIDTVFMYIVKRHGCTRT